MKILQSITKGLAHIAFPNVCVCCGRENTEYERQLCTFCLEERFEDANPDNLLTSSDTILPNKVTVQHALWTFDKGGDLQHLLHQLKYDRLTTIGIDLGRKLGERLKSHPRINEMMTRDELILVPVPLHYLKYRYRGFNQAFKIAQGVRKIWPQIPICGAKQIIRTKNTRSQTGFTLDQRIKNMQDAFKVRHSSVIAGKTVVIIDDVFTTGATTFELSQTLYKEEVQSIVIATVAQA